MESTKVFQVEGVSARQIFEAFKCLETQIQNLKPQQTTAAAEGYLNRQEVAELLRVSVVTVHDWTGKGFLKSYRLGQKVYYKRSEIDAAMIEIKKGGRRDANQ
ncbi:MAG: helix-turn-helix domain-containing protein [Saprospiraceae bacterium]